jgi:hypothetical protein
MKTRTIIVLFVVFMAVWIGAVGLLMPIFSPGF